MWKSDALCTGRSTGNTLAKSQILGGIRTSVPRSTIITQGRQAITESRGRYRVHNFSKPVTDTQKHRNRRMSAQNVKNVLKFTPPLFRYLVMLFYGTTAHRSSTSPVICVGKWHPVCRILKVIHVFAIKASDVPSKYPTGEESAELNPETKTKSPFHVIFLDKSEVIRQYFSKRS